MIQLNYPVASKKNHKITYHNKDFTDPYFWLRQKESTEVLDYLKAENDYFEKNMAPHKDLVENLYQELVKRTKEDDESVPEVYGDYYYYYRIEQGKNYRIYCRKFKSLGASEEIILDLNLLGEGKKFVSLGSYDLSVDHNLIAYSIDFDGYENYKLFVKNLTTKEITEFDIDDLDGSINWGLNNETIYYTKRDKIHRSSYNYRGTFSLASKGIDFKEELLYYEPDEVYSSYMTKTKDNMYLMITSRSSETTEVRFLDLKTQEMKLFRERSFSTLYYLFHRNGYFYILTNENAINFKVLRVKVIDFDHQSSWETFVPGTEEVKIDRLEMFEKFIVMYIRQGGLKNVRIFIEESNQWHDIVFPEPLFTINNRSGPSNFEYSSPTVRFYFDSLKTPKTVFDYDPFTRKLELKKRDEIFGGYDPSNYFTERKFVKARDGTEIPISIMHLKTVTRNSAQPTYLYGYGSYGMSMEPGFNAYMLSLIDRGFIFVMAHIRGGGEMGRKWYLEGKYLKKKNTFTDFIDVAEFLINQKYTDPTKLAISGGSAGGLLIGAVLNMRPDLFKVAKLNVPFVDVINTMMDASIPLTTFEYEEWGNPNQEEYFDYMLSYSPYDNIKAQNYPHIIVTAGLNDPRVHYWEPAKYVAKLRDLKTDSNDLVFRTNMGAGHAGSSGKYSYIKEIASEYTFVLTHI